MLQGRKYFADVMLLPLGSYDLILVAQWLSCFDDELLIALSQIL